MSERMIALGKSGDFFGPLYPYIIDDDVTVCSVTLIETFEVGSVVCSDDLTLSED